jgi:hypothetical protein
MRWIVILAVGAGCKDDRLERDPAPRPMPVVIDAAPVPDAPLPVDANAPDAAVVPLRIGPGGVGPLEPKLAIDKTTLAALVPGYTVEVVVDSFEGVDFEVFDVKSGAAAVLRVVPADGVIDSIIVFSAAIPSDLGVAVGTPYATAVAELGPFDCELSYHDEPLFPEQAGCAAGAWQLIFDNSPNLGEGAKLPAKRQAKLLRKSKVEAMVLN